MPKKKTVKRARKPEVDSADGVRVGEEPVPGMRLRCICRGHQGTIGRIAWSPCGRFIASPSSDKTIRIWDANDGKCLRVLKDFDGKIHSVAWSPDVNVIACGDEKAIKVLNWPSGQILNSKQHQQVAVSLAWSPSGEELAIASADWNGQHYSSSGLFMLNLATDSFTKLSRDPHFYEIVWAPNSIAIVGAGVFNDHLTMFPAETPTSEWGRWENCWDISFSPHNTIATGSNSGNVLLWEPSARKITHELEGHEGCVTSVSFGADGKLLASLGDDNKLIIWRCDTWHPVVILPVEDSATYVEFGPSTNLLAVTAYTKNKLRVWQCDFELLASLQSVAAYSGYTSAKIVLVGESNVGKSCLAMRLAEDRYPDDHEHGTTHGMRFWPMEAEKLYPAAKSPEGQRRDVVLWDFGGQDEYQLVHQMFLHDTTLALVLIDPTRGRAAMAEARDWNKRLEKHLGKDRAVKLLVGAKVDKKRDLIDRNSIDALCKECGFAAFLDLSAKTGRNTRRLRKLISGALDWDQMAKTSRPELFQRIRDEIEEERKGEQVVILLADLRRTIDREEFDDDYWTDGLDDYTAVSELHRAVEAVTDQLASQGLIVKTKLMTGDEALVLQLPVIERYAGSLIIAARNNPRGVPVLEERLLGSTKTIPLPGMTKKERLSPTKERMILECIVELMIQHGICFRYGGLLVFPTLFPDGGTDDEKLSHSVSLYYDFTGAIDNIYASLVSKLMVGEEFGEGRLRAGRVEFERGRQGICGVRQMKRAGGLAHMDLFFSEKTKPDRRDLFTRFVEEHLKLHGVDIREHEAMKCKCGEDISERIVQTRIAAGERDVVCPVCETKTLIGEGAERIRQRSPETDAKMVALRKSIDKKLAEDIRNAKKAVAGEIRTVKVGEPIRILHLSDLHFTSNTNPETKLRLLLQDIRQKDEDYAAIETVEYLVISGDMTDKGKDAGFEKARQFVESLVNELGLSTQRCIFVPGNHDLQDRADAYEEREDENGNTIRVRHPENFPKRFEQFSNGFFHPLVQKNYPLRYADQGISYLFPDTGIQFLTLNSAWEIDKNGRKKASIHSDAVANLIARAEDERKRAVEREDLKRTRDIFRIGVWHHAVAGPELMQNLGFLTQLQKAGMQLCLHGDVHEMRTGLFGYLQPGISVEIVGAGSFGSEAEGRPESTPKLYNLLEVFTDPKTKQHKSIRVHTRQQRKSDEAWQGWHEWTDPDGGKGRLPYFDIKLS